MIRVSTLLKPETLDLVQKDANDKSISVAAIIRQKVEASYNQPTHKDVMDAIERQFKQKNEI